MKLTKKQEEIRSIVQSRLGNDFTVVIEDDGGYNDTAIIEYPIEGRYARVMAFFPAVDGRRTVNPAIIDSIIYVATTRFKEQMNIPYYTEQAKADARAAYQAIIKATQS